MMKRFSLLLALVATVALAVVSTTAAAPNSNNQSGGAAGVVAAVVQVQDNLNDLRALNNLNISDIEVVTVKRSLNNVLRNARFLNNITILQNFLNNPDCSVVAVCDSLQNFLNNNNVQISDVVAIDVLSGGDVVIFQR